MLDEVVRGREGRVELAKVDIDQLPELAMQYGVSWYGTKHLRAYRVLVFPPYIAKEEPRGQDYWNSMPQLSCSIPLLQVTAVPAVLGFSGGEVKGQFVGAQEKKFVQDFIDTLAR